METLKDLAGLKHYFLHWNGPDKVTSDMIPEKMKEFDFLNLVTTGAAISAEAEEDDECMEIRNLQRCLIPFVQLFLEIVAEDLQKAKNTMNELIDTMTFEFEPEFSEEYIPGFEYLYKLVQLHAHLAFKHVPGYDELEHCMPAQLDLPLTQLDLEAKYGDLGNKSKCVVVAARWMLISTNHNRRREESNYLIEITKLDDTNWYWYTLAYNRVRYLRKHSGCVTAERSGPSQEEIDLVTNSLKHVCTKVGRQRCVAYLCQCLADIVAFQCKTGKFQSVTLDRKYTNVVNMVDHLKSSATEAIFSSNWQCNELVRFGEIFGISLPSEYRDYFIAAACLKTVCAKYPDNSKANHKMGAIIINSKRDIKDAIYYLEQAIKLSPRSFAAWMDLLPALLRDYKENEAKVKEVLEVAQRQEHQWTKTELGAFDFYEGSLAFLTGFEKKAVKLWRKSLKREYDGFKWLGIIRARFGWPNHHPLTFEALRSAIDLIHKRQLEVVDQITKLQKMVDEADEKTSQFYRHKGIREREDKNWRSGQAASSRDYGRSTSIPPGSWRNHGGSSSDKDEDMIC